MTRVLGSITLVASALALYAVVRFMSLREVLHFLERQAGMSRGSERHSLLP